MIRITCFIILMFLAGLPIIAQEGYPEPSDKNGLLFYIQHNRGKNTFFYSLNYRGKHQLDQDDPIKVQRELYDEDGAIKPLSAVQRAFAYGISTKKRQHGYEAAIVSMPSQKLYLFTPAHKPAYVETTVNGKSIRLKRIFIKQKDGTSGLGTKVDYILFYGTHNNKAVIEKLIP
ncbi:DUF4833 domain-containing protein [Sphingobacterium lactis]|nr:DUF4833 domain-containing protein [Sphingobacterium lactis]